MNVDHYSYRVVWSTEDNEYVGLCAEMPSMSFLAANAAEALAGIRKVVAEAYVDIQTNNEHAPR